MYRTKNLPGLDNYGESTNTLTDTTAPIPSYDSIVPKFITDDNTRQIVPTRVIRSGNGPNFEDEYAYINNHIPSVIDMTKAPAFKIKNERFDDMWHLEILRE